MSVPRATISTGRASPPTAGAWVALTVFLATVAAPVSADPQRQTEKDQMILVSRADGAAVVKGNNASSAPSLSADGRYVAFQSNATNLHPDKKDSGIHDVLVRDLHTHQTILVSRWRDSSSFEGLTPRGAIRRVRRTYCDEAVESQERAAMLQRLAP